MSSTAAARLRCAGAISTLRSSKHGPSKWPRRSANCAGPQFPSSIALKCLARRRSCRRGLSGNLLNAQAGGLLGNTYLIACTAATTSLLDVLTLAGQPGEEVRIAGEAMELRDCLTTSDYANTSRGLSSPGDQPRAQDDQ